MSQSRMGSLKESITNVATGVVIAFASQVIIFKAMGIPVRLEQNVAMTIYFTAISLVRSYAIRRWFNKKHK